MKKMLKRTTIIFLILILILLGGIKFFLDYQIFKEIWELKGRLYFEKNDFPLLKDVIGYIFTIMSILITSILTYFIYKVNKNTHQLLEIKYFKEKTEDLNRMKYFVAALEHFMRRILHSKERFLGYIDGDQTLEKHNDETLDFFKNFSKEIYLKQYYNVFYYENHYNLLIIFEKLIEIEKISINTINKNRYISRILQEVIEYYISNILFSNERKTQEEKLGMTQNKKIKVYERLSIIDRNVMFGVDEMETQLTRIKEKKENLILLLEFFENYERTFILDKEKYNESDSNKYRKIRKKIHIIFNYYISIFNLFIKNTNLDSSFTYENLEKIIVDTLKDIKIKIKNDEVKY